MKRSKNNFTVKPHKPDGCGDLTLWYRLMNSKAVQMLFTKTKKALFDLLMFWRKFICQAIIFSVAIFFRYRFSKQNIGLFLLLYSISIPLVLNSKNLWFIFKPLTVPIAPLLPFFFDTGQLYSFLFVNIESSNLLYFTLASAIIGIIQVVMAWFGDIKADFRGESFLHRVLYNKVSQRIENFHLTFFMEVPVISFLAFFFIANDDPLFGAYLAVAAFLITTQELTARADYQKMQSILRA